MESQDQMTEEQVMDAVSEIAEGSKMVSFRGKDIVFTQLTLGESATLTRLYQKEVTRLTLEEGTINEAMIPGLVAKKVRELGLDPRIMDERFRLETLINFYKKAGEGKLPDVLSGVEPSVEAIEDLLGDLEDVSNKFTSEELDMINQVNSAAEFHNSLMESCVETRARAWKLRNEMVVSAKDLEGNPIWSSVEELDEELDDKDLKRLFVEYRQYKEGHSLDFLSESPPPVPGETSGDSQEEKPKTSSKEKSRSGRKPKNH